MAVTARRFSSDESWGGRALILLAWATVLAPLATNVIDGTTRTITSIGEIRYEATGNVGGIVGVSIFGLGVIVAAVGILRGTRFRLETWFATLMVCALAWWAAAALVFRRDAVDQEQAIFVIGAVVVIFSVVVSPPTIRTLHAFNAVRDVAVALMLIVSVFLPESGQLPCRADKCGAFGSLYTGFFYQENAAATFVVLLVPAAITIVSRARLTMSLILVVLFLLGTGSRTSLLGLAVVVTFVLVHRRSVIDGRPSTVAWYWRALPLVLLVASAFVFVAYSGSELTGRGYIYKAIRQQISGYDWLFGTGPATMEQIFEMRIIGFNAAGEHGQVPHLFAQTGLVGVLLFAAALIAIALSRRTFTPAQVAAVGLLVAASLQFVTEPGWTFNPRTPHFVLMLLSIGLFLSMNSLRGHPAATSSSRELRTR